MQIVKPRKIKYSERKKMREISRREWRRNGKQRERDGAKNLKENSSQLGTQMNVIKEK